MIFLTQRTNATACNGSPGLGWPSGSSSAWHSMTLLRSVSQPLPFTIAFRMQSPNMSSGQHEVFCVPSYLFNHWLWVPEPRLVALKCTVAINHCGISSNATSFTMPSWSLRTEPLPSIRRQGWMPCELCMVLPGVRTHCYSAYFSPSL